MTLGYDIGRRLSQITDPAGQITRYSYDTNNNLVRVTYPDSTAKLYHYENATYPHHLTGISLDNGAGVITRLSTYAYDATGKAISTEHAGAQEKFTLAYDSASQTTVTDAIGNKEVMTFAVNLGVKNLVSKKTFVDNKTLTQTFDTNNNLTCQQDEEGRVTTWIYNTANQKESMTEGQAGSCTAPTPTAVTRTTTYQYLSAELDLPTLIESPSVAGGSYKKQVEITYDAPAHPTLPRTITQRGYTPSGTAVSRAITLGYNSVGQVTSIDGPRTDVSDITTLAYNECSTGGGCGQLKSLTNALAQVTTFDAYDANGRLIEQTDPNGLKTVYGYDLRGRVLSVTLQAPDGSTRLTGYQYDAAGNVTEVKTPDGRVLTYTYDAAQDLRTVTDNAGNKVEYGYDLKGNRTASKTYDPQGTLVRSIELAFDARNRLEQINDGGSITRQVWDAVGNLTTVTDPNTVAANGTAATVNEYDALNRLFKTTDRLSGITQYGYAVNDRVQAVVAPNTAATGYVVDDLDNVLQETSPDRGVLVYSYDTAGNAKSVTDARGITVTYGYDALNRLSAATFPDATENVTYSYDTCTHGQGRLCAVTDAAGSVAYAYDGFGALAEETRTELGVSYTTRYGYDALNRVASITYPDGRVVAYARNSLGQVTDVTLTQAGTPQPLASQLTYRADGLVSGLTYGNGLSESRLYTLAGRLETWTTGTETRGFLYDANGNLKNQTGSTLANFGYDALDRLQSESLQSFSQTLGYDANGNRQSDGTGSYSYLAASNRLTTVGATSITLDPAGNTLADPLGRTFSYYGASTLRQAVAKVAAGRKTVTNTTTYAYDFRNLRTRKTVNGVTTMFHYDQAGRLLAETSATGAVQKVYVWLEDRPLAQFAVVTTTSKGKTVTSTVVSYLHTDPLDTPRFATNSAGTTVWRWEGEAFGNTQASEDPDGDGSATTVNLRFPGQYYDAETGLHYNWNRYYDPKIGRYITSDPMSIREHVGKWKSTMGMPGQPPLEINSYLYVSANPLQWTDPKGLEVKICCRPAEIAGGLVDHCWVQTDTVSAGMGANPDIPPGEQYEGYGMSVQVTDHSKDKGTYCIPQNNVDEKCVNDKLKVGESLGRFLPPYNQCQSFAYGTVNACRTGPQILPQITPSK